MKQGGGVVGRRICFSALKPILAAILFIFPFSPALSEQPDWPDSLKKTKKPNEFVEWGWDLRIRDERFPDALDRIPHKRDPIREWIRIRSRIFADFKLMDNLKLKTRVTNESRLIESPDHYQSPNPYDRYDHFDVTLFDNFFLELKTDGVLPVTWRIGRQDMLAMPGATGIMGTGFGSGLILMDGSPGDGSRSFFFDAARATIDLDEWIPKSSLDIFVIHNDAYSHDHLPNIGGIDSYKRLDSWNSNALGLYYKNASWLEDQQIDLYYIYKTEDQLIREPWEKTTAIGSVVNTAGFRYSGKLRKDLHFELEGATQWGVKDTRQVRAFASQESVEQTFEGRYKPKAKLFHAYLSGDDPDTNTIEAWQQVYGRWPKWGELIGYMGPPEDGIYYFTNMHILGVQTEITPAENWTLTGVVQALYADENTYRGRPGFSDSGRFRGWNPQVNLAWSPTKYLTTHLLYEWFFEGNYMEYPANRADYSFFRVDLVIKF